MFPIKYRGFVLSSVWTGYTLGQFVMLVVMLYCMPNLEKEKTYDTMIISLIFPVIAIFTSFLIVEDSPRNLILNNRENYAFEILENIYKRPIQEEKKIRIINYTKSGANEQVKGNLCDIFDKVFAKTTILLTFIRSNHALCAYGILAINTLTLNHLNHDTESNNLNHNSNKMKFDENMNGTNNENLNNQILVDELLICVIIVISDIYAGILSEIQFLGRKFSMIINYFFGFLFMLLCPFFTEYFSLFLGFSLNFVSVASVINETYVLEVYNTKIRDKANGFLMSFRRIGGFISQALFVYLDGVHMWSPYYISSVMFFINVFLCSFLEKETYNKSIE